MSLTFEETKHVLNYKTTRDTTSQKRKRKLGFKKWLARNFYK